MECVVTRSIAESSPSTLVVLLHGFLGDRRDLQRLHDSFTRAGLGCLSVDLPGHGDSAWLGGNVHDALRSLLATLGASCPAPSQLVLIGYSMGGRLALQLAAQSPWRVAAVIVLSGSPGIANERARQERLARDTQLASRLRTMTSVEFAAWLREEWYRAKIWGALSEHERFELMLARRTEGARPSDRAASLEQESVGRQPSLLQWLEAPPMPVLFLAGAADPAYSRFARELGAAALADEQSERRDESRDCGDESRDCGGESRDCGEVSASKGRTAQGVVIDGAGHAVLTEAPLQVEKHRLA